jgi:UDP-2,3-diacylglucosamine pyrophosphatase LpxH
MLTELSTIYRSWHKMSASRTRNFARPSAAMHKLLTEPTDVRSIFISDQHLGFRFSRAAECLQFLRRYRTERLYLVGDFLDGWRLTRRWHWPEVYDRIIDHVLDAIDQGTRVYYTPGNHDDFLRQPHPAIDGVQVADEFIHGTPDGRRLLVTHGDLFDSVEKKFHRISRFGSSVYDGVTNVNYVTNRLLGAIGIGEFNYCFAAKRLSKVMVGAVAGFQSVLTGHARERGCHGVICGHIHRPTLEECGEDRFIYCNTGDWVENQSAVVELLDGSLVLVNRGQQLAMIEGSGADPPAFGDSLVTPAQSPASRVMPAGS